MSTFQDNFTGLEIRHKCSMRKQPTFCDPTNSFPAKWHVRKERRNSILRMLHYPVMGSASDWLKQMCNQSEALSSSGWWCVISMEFLRSFLTRHFRGNPLVAPRNVGCFIRLLQIQCCLSLVKTVCTVGMQWAQDSVRNRNSLHMDAFILTPFPTSHLGFSPARPCEVERTLGLRLDTTVCILGH